MSEIKIPALADTFNDEYRLTDMSIEESTDTMRMRANQKVQQIIQQQREKDRKEFFGHFFKWKEETLIHSNLNIVYGNEHYKALSAMGRRAVPFIYELAVNENILLKGVLEKIYDMKIKTRQPISLEDADRVSEEIKNAWICKIELEGDV